jgi:hypothetical protein
MATGAFHVAYEYELYVALGTSASSIPTSSSGLTRVYSLSNASVKGSSSTIDAIDYETGLGGKRKLINEVEYELPAAMNISLADPGYHIMHRAWLQGAAGTLLRFYRKTPVFDGSTDDPESYAGLVSVADFDKDEESGKIATVKFTMQGYGMPIWRPQGRAAATFTVTTGGSGLAPATYTNVALVGVNNDNGCGTAATCSVTVAGGGTVSAAPTVTLGGRNYNVGDVLTVALADVGGSGTDVAPTFTVATVAA